MAVAAPLEAAKGAAMKYLEPIKRRSPGSLAHSIFFNAFFMLAIVSVAPFQYLSLPLLLWPEGTPQRQAYRSYHRWIKSYWSSLLVIIAMFWAPTKFVFTSDGTVDLESDDLVKRNERGEVVKLELSKRAVWMANHQIYADWLYLWNLAHFAGQEDSLIIMLKKELKWAPIVGPAMQFFEFVWMARNWEQDRVYLGHELTRMGRRAQKSDESLNLLIFPEGTLVSSLTRPGSRKWAEKLGVPDMKYQLIPRSLGLLFSLRSLASRIPALELWDFTIGYGGMPESVPSAPPSRSEKAPTSSSSGIAYGQDYFTLQSIYGAGQPPTSIHVHLRRWRVVSGSGDGGLPSEGEGSGLPSVPIGVLTHAEAGKAELQNGESIRANGEPMAGMKGGDEVGGMATEEERKYFDEWLRGRWAEKDSLLRRFYRTGRFDLTHENDPEEEEGFVRAPQVKKGSVEMEVAFSHSEDLIHFFVVLIGAGLVHWSVQKMIWRWMWWMIFK